MAFEREWLHSFPAARRQVLFERTGEHFEFGRNLKGQNVSIVKFGRDNSLFLSTAAQSVHDELSKITKFFRKLNSTLIFNVTEKDVDRL